MQKILSYAALIIWSLPFIYPGLPDLYYKLGGAFELYVFIMPCLLLLTFTSPYFRNLIWSIALTLTGMISANYFSTLLAEAPKNFSIITTSYIVSLSSSLPLICGAVYTVISLFGSPNGTSGKQDYNDPTRNVNALKSFYGFTIGIFTASCMLSIILLPSLDFTGFKRSYLGYMLSLSGFMLGNAIFIFCLRNFSTEALSPLLKVSPTSCMHMKRSKGLFLITLFVLLFLSIGHEFRGRNDWSMLAVTYFGLFLYSLFLFRLARPMFSSRLISETKFAEIVPLPSIRDRKYVIAILMIILLYFCIWVLLTIGDFFVNSNLV